MKNCIHCQIKSMFVNHLKRILNTFRIRFQHRRKNLRPGNLPVYILHLLYRVQFSPHHLCHGLLKLRISFIAEMCGKSNDSGLTDAHNLAQPCRRKKHRFIIVVGDICGNPFLPFAQGGVPLIDSVH